MFEINVSLNGEHVFATHQRSLHSELKAFALIKRLRLAFPEEEGYKISLSAVSTTSRKITIPDDIGAEL